MLYLCEMPRPDAPAVAHLRTAAAEHMLNDARQRDDARNALHVVAPVAGPWIDVDVAASAEGNEHAIARVEHQWDKYEDPLQQPHHRQAR